MERVVTSPDPYAAIALSQGIKVGNLAFISGQAGYDDNGDIVKGGFDAQSEQAFSNLRRALEAAGSSLKDVVKVSIFLTDMSHFDKLVALRKKHFSEPYPADTLLEVKGLYSSEAVIEIEAIGLVTA